MRITKGRLRQIIREVIKENFLHEESTDPRIASMHDKYDLSTHKLFDPNDIDLLVDTYMYERYQFEKVTLMSALPDRLAKLLVEYNARVYYDKNLEDSQKLALMIDNIAFKENTKKEMMRPNPNNRDAFEFSGDGVKFILYYIDQNAGLLDKTTAKVTISLTFNPNVQNRLLSFLKEKGVVEK